MLADGESFTAIATAVRLLSGVYRPLERAVRNRAARRLAGEVSRTTADGADASARGARLGEDASEAVRRQHPLEYAQAGARCWASVTCWSRACGAAPGYQPHRLERYMLSDDPQFEEKAADVIGLYLNPPQHAVVFAVDEKTAIQALDRLDPVLPLSPGRAERHGFEYYRHGTLSLYAAFNTKTGEVSARPCRATRGRVRRLPDRHRGQSAHGREIHVIVDNLSAHKTKRVERSSTRTPTFICTSRRPTRPGSTKSSCGSPRSSAT